MYEKAFKESEKAQDNYQKADADLNLSRAEVEKVGVVNSISRKPAGIDSGPDYQPC